jgi:hypothetical protein
LAECSHCKTERDYLMDAIPHIIGFYLGTGIFLFVLSIFGRVEYARYWRFTSLACVATLELLMMVSPNDPLPGLLPWRTVGEKATVLRQCYIVISIATSHIGPILFPDECIPMRHLLLDLEDVLYMHSKQARNSFESTFEPFSDDPNALGLLQRRMEKLALENQLIESEAALQAKNKTK